MLMIQKPMNMIWAGSVACEANPAPTHAVRNGSKSGIATTVKRGHESRHHGEDCARKGPRIIGIRGG